MTQLELGLKVAVAKEVNGLEMGVLSDGRSYLSARTLAKLCGVVPSAVITQAANWKAGKRDGRLAQMLREAGIDELYTAIGDQLHAYHEDACMVFVEYYAFEAREQNAQALNTFRKLGRAGLRAFVYSALGYDPRNELSPAWQHFHARVMLIAAPAGYFCVFNESNHLVVSAMRAGLRVDQHTVPDISLGQLWSAYWKENAYEDTYGPRKKHDHNYPDFFPQAASNPQHMWVYPLAALPAYRAWLETVYIPTKYPQYLKAKVKEGLLPPSAVEMLVLAATPPEPHLLESDIE